MTAIQIDQATWRLRFDKNTEPIHYCDSIRPSSWFLIADCKARSPSQFTSAIWLVLQASWRLRFNQIYVPAGSCKSFRSRRPLVFKQTRYPSQITITIQFPESYLSTVIQIDLRPSSLYRDWDSIRSTSQLTIVNQLDIPASARSRRRFK